MRRRRVLEHLDVPPDELAHPLLGLRGRPVGRVAEVEDALDAGRDDVGCDPAVDLGHAQHLAEDESLDLHVARLQVEHLSQALERDLHRVLAEPRPRRVRRTALEHNARVQVAQAADVDLVLMDGCINDVGVAKILNPNTSEGEIGSFTQHLCGGGVMEARLGQIHSRFPNAKILLTGYFPIISDSSDLTAVAALLINVGALAGSAAPLFGIPIDPVTGAIAGLITSQIVRDKAVSHSATFHAVSTSSLTTAAINANQRFGGNRIRFVGIPFTGINAYAAPDTWLWLLPTPGVPISNGKDEVFDQRARVCSAVQNTPATCFTASAGHPNVKGAQAYANAITGALGEFMAGWRAAHATVQSTQ